MKRRIVLAGAAAAVVAALSLTSLAGTSAADDPKVELMFVQTAEDLKADPATSTLRLVNVAPQAVYFSDRPVRIAGHLTMEEYMEEWTSKAGSDNFSADPPNATLSVYEDGNPQSTLVVIELLDPVIDGKDLVYHYKLIEGEMPRSGGQTAVFIDWIGPGGGVGVGFHGVGVGARGPGVAGWAGVAARNTACAASASCY